MNQPCQLCGDPDHDFCGWAILAMEFWTLMNQLKFVPWDCLSAEERTHITTAIRISVSDAESCGLLRELLTPKKPTSATPE
jgi:hypothetical protein